MNLHQEPEKSPSIMVRPFTMDDWYALWKLQTKLLAEDGIILDEDAQGPPDFNLVYDESNPNYYEMDLERIDVAYLSGRGNFWIAWVGDQPVGRVGAQDLGDYVELRRMAVRREYQRQGIGTLLVQALIDHCAAHKVGVIKLWTSDEGPGRFLYRTLGFRQVELTEDEQNSEPARGGEIRMVLELSVDRSRGH